MESDWFRQDEQRQIPYRAIVSKERCILELIQKISSRMIKISIGDPYEPICSTIFHPSHVNMKYHEMTFARRWLYLFAVFLGV